MTDCFPLHAAAQTLAAGNVSCPGAAGAAGAAGLAAQVTSAAVVLFSTQPGPASRPSRQSSGALGTPEPASSSSGALGSSAAPAWQPPAGSSIGAAAVAEETVLLFCTGGSRQLLALLAAAPAAGSSAQEGGQLPPPQLVPAASMPLSADVSCISNLLPQPAAAASRPPQQLQQHSAVFAVGTYASTVLLLALRWEAQQPAAASLSRLQVVDLSASSIPSSMPTAAAAAAAAAAAGATPFSPRAFQREQLTPESLLLLPAPAAAGGGGSGPAGAAAAAAAVGAASLVVGLRTGSLLQMRFSWDGEQGQQEELLAVSIGHMPVVLLPLPPQPSPATAAAGVPPPAAAALSDRLTLLHGPSTEAVGGGRLRCQPLALPHVQVAAPLLLDSGSLGASSCMLTDAGPAEPEAAGCGAASGVQPAAQQQQQQQQQQQLFLLCAASDGCLRMVSLEPQQLATSRCWPLPYRLQPSRLAVHAASGCVAVAGASRSLPQRRAKRPRPPWLKEEEEEQEAPAAAVQLIDPASGEALLKTFPPVFPACWQAQHTCRAAG